MKKFFTTMSFLLAITPLYAMNENQQENQNEIMIQAICYSTQKKNDNMIDIPYKLDEDNESVTLIKKEQNHHESLSAKKIKRCEPSDVIIPVLVLLISAITFSSVIGATFYAFVNRHHHNGTSPNSTSIF